jgi:hypothetical protein
MWFVFPQLAGLGFSAMAQRFAIESRGEAVAYLAHDVLGPRLIKCTRLVMAASARTIDDILGSPDDMKFRSSARHPPRRNFGIELQRRLVASGSKCPVIFMTANDDEATRNEAVDAGCIAYLRKPFARQVLLDAIGKAVA